MSRPSRMRTNDFSRDPARDSAPDHGGYDESEQCGPEPPRPTLTASVAWIQDSAFVAHCADGSRSADLPQYYPAPYGPSPRSPERDIFHSSPIHRGATDVGHEWRPFVDSPDLVRTQGRAQRNIPHVLLASVSPWNNGICDPPASDSSLPSFGGLTPPADTEFSLWPQGVYAYEFFTSHPNLVSGGTIFPQDGAPLIQLPYPPYYAAYPIRTVEHTQSNQPPLSSGSRGPPLIVNQDYDSPTQHTAPASDPHGCDSSFSPNIWMDEVPQRPYGRARDREKCKSIIFNVNGCLGIPALDAIGKMYAGLEGRDEQVFVGQSKVIMLRLEWPGYLPWSRKIRLSDWKKTPQRIKLDKLATEVAKCLDRFILEVHTGKHPDRECSDWRVGPEFIGIDRLVLVGLDKVSRGSWQPRIGLLSA